MGNDAMVLLIARAAKSLLYSLPRYIGIYYNYKLIILILFYVYKKLINLCTFSATVLYNLQS